MLVSWRHHSGHYRRWIETQFGRSPSATCPGEQDLRRPTSRTGGRLINLASQGNATPSDLQDTKSSAHLRPMGGIRRSRQHHPFRGRFDLRHRDRGIRAAAVHRRHPKRACRHLRPGSVHKRRSTESAKNQQQPRQPFKTKTILKEPPLRLGLALSTSAERSADRVI